MNVNVRTYCAVSKMDVITCYFQSLKIIATQSTLKHKQFVMISDKIRNLHKDANLFCFLKNTTY